MAEIDAGAFIPFLVERLGDVLIQEGSSSRGITGQVEQMQTELERMQCFLKDAAARQEGDERLHNFIAEITEVAYDAEDVIDTFVVKVAFKRRTGTGILNVLMRYSCVVKDCIAIHKVGVKIESIKTKISNIMTSLENHGIKAISEGENSSSRHERERLIRKSYPHIMEDDIVGLDEDLKMIVEHLVKEERQCQVVSIWGMGGLGKTTLAKKVYHHNDVRRHFHSFAWAFISQQCKTREVLEGILIKLSTDDREKIKMTEYDEPIEKLDKEKIKMMNLDELVEKLFEVQSQKKCLVVIDDIWKAEDWKILSPAFPNTKVAGSKILLTTRKEEVALCADKLHELKLLNEVESWDLFEKKAILKRNDTEFELSTKMMELGKEMVKHCGGLPLAIVVLGGLLATKHKMDEWEMVSRNIRYYLNKSEGHGHGGLPVSNILALSYQDLPYHLQACFLYLSHFPEDYDIDAETLVQMWMGEGFVSSFNVGMSYLGELAQRCMVQIQLLEFTNRIEFCRLHDLMRDLCLSKAQEENFVKVGRLDFELTWANSASSYSYPSSLPGIRKLAVHYFGDYIALNELEKTNLHYLRSCQFYFFGKKWENLDWKQIESFLKGLKSLRILHLESSPIRDAKNMMLPNLFHLRYLGIRGFGIESLPSSIGRPIHLKCLCIRDCNIKELSSSIGKLTHLECLSIKNSNIKELPSSIGRLIHLEYLSIKNSNIKELPSSIGSLIHLEYLSIKNSNIKELPSSIGKLVFLQTLDLRPDAFSKIRIPNVLCRLEQLRHLYLPSFMELPSTDKLRLDGLTKLETLKGFTTEYCDVRCFPELTNLQKIKVWVDNKDLAVILQSPSLSYSNPLVQSSFYIVGDFQTEAEQSLLRQLLGCHHLHKLDLCNTKLEEDPMPTLEELPNLTKLGLRWDSYIGKEMVCSSAPTTTTTSTAAASSSSGGRGYGCNGGFPQLKFLRLLGIRNLEEWRVEEGAMSTLFHLEIYFCPKLKEIPDGLRFITTLRELKIRGVSQVLKNRVREGGEDFYKVRHVPFITIFDY